MDLATRKVPKLNTNHSSVWHANVSGNRHLDCPSSSYGARDMKFHIFQNGGGGHFKNWAVAELAVTFERYIGAHFCSKWFKLSNQ